MKKIIINFLAATLVAFIVIFSFMLYPPTEKSLRTQVNIEKAIPKILIDAGHGGIDGGAIAKDGTKESGINLEISLKLRDFVSVMGFSAKLTRETDVSIHDDAAKSIRSQKISDIHNRLDMFENGDFEFMISIHQNKFSESKYRGTQVFYSGNNEKSKVLAELIQNCVKEKIQPENSREIKRCPKNIYLLYHAKKPAVLVECGFLSNFAETELLKSSEYQNKLCFAILNGIIYYSN